MNIPSITKLCLQTFFLLSLFFFAASIAAPQVLASPPVFDSKSSSGGLATWKHQVGNNPNRILFVGVGGTPTAVTYDGLALTKIAVTGGSDNATLWYLINPPAGNKSIVLTGAINAGAVTYYNVDTIYPLGSRAANSGSYSFMGVLGLGIGSTTFYPNLTLNNTNTNQAIVDTVGWGGSNTVVGATFTATPYYGDVSAWVQQTTSGVNFLGMGQYDTIASAGSIKPAAAYNTSVGWIINITTLGTVSGTWGQTAVAVNGLNSIVSTPTPTPTPPGGVVTQCPNTAPTDLLLIIDHSLSMNDRDYYSTQTKMQAAIAGVQKFITTIQQNNPQTRVGVIQFAGSYQYPNRPSATGVVAPFSLNYTAIKNAVGNIPLAVGDDIGTCISCALDLANQTFATTSTSTTHKIAILITDGITQQLTNSNGYNVEYTLARTEALVKVSEGLNTHDLIYRTIGVGTAAQVDEPFLKQVGAGKGGLYFNNPAYGSFDKIFQAISNVDFSCYGLSGNVFIDENNNGVKDAGEVNYAGAPDLSSSRQLVTSEANGTFFIKSLSAGPVTISYPSLPLKYSLTYPLNGPPPSHNVTVGPTCDTNSIPSATCVNGSVQNLNFGIINYTPWWQSVCGGIRMDNGITNPIPQTAQNPYLIRTNATCTEPGVVAIGDSFSEVGTDVSSRKWLVGGTTYPEVYTSSSPVGISTSYNAMSNKAQKAQLPITDLSTICTLSNCTLPANLPHGIYKATGDVALNAFTSPANQNYVFLINGNLTIKGNIIVPTNSTISFSSSNNISVASTVGVAANSDQTSIEGIYSADKSFVIPTNGGCSDLRLNIGGNIIVNAARGGGSLQNSRDLCSSNSTYPSMSIVQRLDFLLNVPEFLRVPNAYAGEALQ